jgi:hypothetical protein
MRTRENHIPNELNAAPKLWRVLGTEKLASRWETGDCKMVLPPLKDDRAYQAIGGFRRKI